MKRWTLIRSLGRQSSPAAGPAAEALAEEAGLAPRTAPLITRDPAGGLSDPYFLLPETRFQVPVDDAGPVAVSLGEQNAGAVVEATQRVREHHERERAAVPPVYNFGADSSWSGGDW